MEQNTIPTKKCNMQIIYEGKNCFTIQLLELFIHLYISLYIREDGSFIIFYLNRHTYKHSRLNITQAVLCPFYKNHKKKKSLTKKRLNSLPTSHRS